MKRPFTILCLTPCVKHCYDGDDVCLVDLLFFLSQCSETCRHRLEGPLWGKSFQTTSLITSSTNVHILRALQSGSWNFDGQARIPSPSAVVGFHILVLELIFIESKTVNESEKMEHDIFRKLESDPELVSDERGKSRVDEDDGPRRAKQSRLPQHRWAGRDSAVGAAGRCAWQWPWKPL